MSEKALHTTHRFLDEAGDTTFYGKKRRNIIGTEGVSNCFILGMVSFHQPLEILRQQITALQEQVAGDAFFQVPSVQKKIANGGYFFHAKDDLPEIKKLFLDYILRLDFSFEAIAARKSVERFATKHKDKEEYFYADVLSHLLKNKLHSGEKLVLNIGEKGTSTKNNNLALALEKAKQRYAINQTADNLRRAQPGEAIDLVSRHHVQANIVFNETRPLREPLLNVTDYLCWVVQRVLERGEVRYYNYMLEKIGLVVDLYDTEKYEGYRNYYTKENPLTAENKISPPLH